MVFYSILGLGSSNDTLKKNMLCCYLVKRPTLCLWCENQSETLRGSTEFLTVGYNSSNLLQISYVYIWKIWMYLSTYVVTKICHVFGLGWCGVGWSGEFQTSRSAVQEEHPREARTLRVGIY